jgi:LPS O-antigen subunit length determinant protein (WzzB/FepE family)
MAKFTHAFDVSIANAFESDKEDFGEAFNEWIKSFDSTHSLRKALLNSDESTKSIIQGVQHSETYAND